MRWNGLRLSVTLLTVFPVRRHAAATGAMGPDRATAAAAMAWAPGVGLLLGAIAAAVLVAVDHPLGGGPLTGAALALAALALLTRGLHLDGLADLADGLGSGLGRGLGAPAALEIMRRSDIGPFGTVTLILSLLIQFAALGHAESAGPGRGAAALIAAAVTGRLALTWACRRGVPAARPDGLGALVAGTVRPAVAAAVTLATAAAAAAAVALTGDRLGWTLPLAVLAGLAAALLLERHAVRRLGGITGDVLGALAEVAATVTLVVAAMGPRA